MDRDYGRELDELREEISDIRRMLETWMHGPGPHNFGGRPHPGQIGGADAAAREAGSPGYGSGTSRAARPFCGQSWTAPDRRCAKDATYA